MERTDRSLGGAPGGIRLSRRLCLGLILLLALLLRTHNLFQPLTDVFSWRQASTAMMAENFHRGNWNIFFPEVSWTGPGPGYQGREFQLVTYLVALLWKVTGQQEWLGRAVSIAFATWGVFAFYALVRRVWNEERALASALVLAILPGAVFIDRSFLPDPAMLSLVVTSVWLLVLYLQTGRRLALVLLAGTAPLAFVTKPVGLVAVAPMLHAMISGRRHGRATRDQGIAAGLVLLLAIGLTLGYVAWALHLGRTYPPHHVAGAHNWINSASFEAWWDQGYFLRHTWGILLAWVWTIPFSALTALGAFLPPMLASEPGSPGAPGQVRWRPYWLFHFWALGCLALYAVGARELTINQHNLHVFGPFAAAFAGNALVSLTHVGRRRLGAPIPVLAGAALLIYGILLGQEVLRTLYAPERNRQSLALGLALQRWSQPGDLVATIANDVGDPIAIYYSRRRGWVFPPAGLRDHPNWVVLAEDSDSVRHFEALRSQGARWFGAVKNVREASLPPARFWERHRGFREHLDRACEIVEESPDYVLYRIPPSDPSSAPASVSAGP
jgi:4-amino-4-deoxy-L-arabinose transferase-like glycosyltransferase